MIKIQPLKENDFKRVLEIEKELFQDPMTYSELVNFTKQDCFKIWKMEINQIIGYVSFFKIKNEIEIIKIGIDKAYQGKGYGSCLINEMKKAEVNYFFLEVSVENIFAINFYFKNGFYKIGQRKMYYKQKDNSRIDALTLCLKI